MGKNIKIAVIPKDEENNEGKRTYSNVFKVASADIFVTDCEVLTDENITVDITLRNNTEKSIPITVSIICYNKFNQIKNISSETKNVNEETVINVGIDNITVDDGDYVEVMAKVDGNSIYLKKLS